MNCQTCGQAPCSCAFTSEPYCDQCSEDTPCTFKLDAACVFFHWKCTNPVGLPNLGINCNTSLEEILTILDDLVGNNFNTPFIGQESETISWVMGGIAGHSPTAQVKVSEDDGNIIVIHSDGIYASADAEDIIALFAIDEPSGGECIGIQVALGDDGKIHIIPTLDIACLVEQLFESDTFCDRVNDCVAASEATVTPDCEGVVINGTFNLGEESTGSVEIPVTVTGSGTITILIQSAGGEFTGTLTQFVNSGTTILIVPIEYTGDGIDGSLEITISLLDTAIPVDDCTADATVDSTGCINVTITDAPMPDAVANSAYNFSLALNGTSPFVLGSIVKPSWMTISIVGGFVTFTGTPAPGDIGTDIPVSFEVTNCTGGGSDTFSDTIDVTIPAFKYYFADMYICADCGGGAVEEGVPVKLPYAFVVALGKFYIALEQDDKVFFISDGTEIPENFGALELSETNFTLCSSACAAILPQALLRFATTTQDACENTGDVAEVPNAYCTGGVLSNGITVYEDAAGDNPFEGDPGKIYCDENNCKHGTIDLFGVFTQNGTCGGSGFACA